MVFLSGEGPCFWARLFLLLLLTALFALCYRWVMKKEAYKE